MRDHLKKFIDDSETHSVRGLRILVEYFYALEAFRKVQKERIRLISVFGSARAPKDGSLYKSTQNLGGMLFENGFGVVTGASDGVMEAANRGVSSAILKKIMKSRKMSEAKALKSAEYKHGLSRYSAGLGISIPEEADENPFVGTGATFHYFMIRKFFFAMLSKGFIACEGGWGTRDELFEILTLVQTGKAPLQPIIFLSNKPKHFLQDLDFMLRYKYISESETSLVDVVSTPQEAIKILKDFYRVINRIEHKKDRDLEIVFRKAFPSKRKKEIEKMLREKATTLKKVKWTHEKAKKRDKLYLTDYWPESYGCLREVVDKINKL